MFSSLLLGWLSSWFVAGNRRGCKDAGRTLALGAVVALAGCMPGTFEAPPDGGNRSAGGASAARSGGAIGVASGAGGAGAGTGGSGGMAAAPVLNQVRFEPAGAGFVGTQMVTLQPPTAGAVIRYTTDGTIPSRNSAVYAGPIALRETAIVRAFAEGVPGTDLPMNAAVFIRLDEAISGFSSNLPVVVLHTQQSGTLSIPDAPMVNASASIFEPRNGKTALLGTTAFTARIGLRVHGKSSRMFPQKSYAIEVRQPGADVDDDTRGVLGLPAEADYILVAPSAMDRSLVRTALAYTLSNDIGQWASRTRFVEVFLTEKPASPVAMRDYVGVYALVEKIKRGPERVRVERIASDATAAPAVTGGYVFRVDHDANDFSAGGTNFGFVYPETEEFLGSNRKAQKAYLQNYIQEFVDSLAQADFKHPKTGLHYTKYIDVPSFIDNNLL
ncbi:MAG TPA: CotH kinase family protein, partial [Polyangia bacterium]